MRFRELATLSPAGGEGFVFSGCGREIARRPSAMARFLRLYPPEDEMLLTLAIVLLVLWALGFLAFHVTSGLIHILIVLAVIAFIVHFARGTRAAV
jgi:hypothetical protein